MTRKVNVKKIDPKELLSTMADGGLIRIKDLENAYDIEEDEVDDLTAIRSNITLSFDNKSQKILLSILDRYVDRAKEITYGRNRAVMIFDNYVVKIPMNWNGVADNDWEGSIENLEPEKLTKYCVRYARTRAAYFQGFPIVFMERLSLASFTQLRRKYGKIPSWVDCVDCGQVGFNRAGELLAYDYGIR